MPGPVSSGSVSTRLETLSKLFGNLSTPERSMLESDLVVNVDRASDDLRVAHAIASRLGHNDMATRIQRAHRILTRKDEESGELERPI